MVNEVMDFVMIVKKNKVCGNSFILYLFLCHDATQFNYSEGDINNVNTNTMFPFRPVSVSLS